MFRERSYLVLRPRTCSDHARRPCSRNERLWNDRVANGLAGAKSVGWSSRASASNLRRLASCPCSTIHRQRRAKTEIPLLAPRARRFSRGRAPELLLETLRRSQRLYKILKFGTGGSLGKRRTRAPCRPPVAVELRGYREPSSAAGGPASLSRELLRSIRRRSFPGSALALGRSIFGIPQRSGA